MSAGAPAWQGYGNTGGLSTRVYSLCLSVTPYGRRRPGQLSSQLTFTGTPGYHVPIA